MKKIVIVGLMSISFAVCSSAMAANCPRPWKGATNADDCSVRSLMLQTDNVLTDEVQNIDVKIRSGYLEENPVVPFKGNIIYYEGLADSMLNHMPLFQQLTNAGYRIIAFDYMGQGGSSGSMNDTRIIEIGNLGNKIWKLYARDLENFPKKTIIGWSTGGLAAYSQAGREIDVNNIVLIAPGIVPNSFVGEQHPLRGQLDQITLASLTTQIYKNGISNPHLDPIKPNSPLDVPCFAFDLSRVASMERGFMMSGRVNGFVLLSGDNDTYVDAQATRKVLKEKAPHFFVKQYSGALHEIDNEANPNGPTARQDILNFIENSR